jgi:hypothetical protein
MPKYGFLVVEGPHDAEMAYRLLSPFGLKRLTKEDNVDPFLTPLIPRKYPPDGDLQRRMSTPLFVASDTHAVAIYRAEGDKRLVNSVEENLAILDRAQLTGVGIVLDADRDKGVSAAARYADIKTGLTALGLTLPDSPGNIAPGPPHAGAFVLPDNSAQGTLEDLLIECAAQVYPGLLASARAHVAAAQVDGGLNADDLKDFRKPSGQHKALVGSIASILRPCKAMQVSIQDNRWLRGAVLNNPRIKSIQNFLRSLFELP